MKAYVLVTVEAERAREVLAALKQLSTVRLAHLCFGRDLGSKVRSRAVRHRGSEFRVSAGTNTPTGRTKSHD